ncbi:MAG: hypothetical protein ACYTEW_23460, partial [Planctomycetota bacterium]
MPDYLTSTRQTIAFNPEQAYWLDVAQLEQQLTLTDQAHPLTPPVAAALAEALALYQGDFMAGFYLSDAPDFEV